MDRPQYIFQLTGKTLDELIAMANATPGRLIRIDRNGDKTTISIDEGQLKAFLWRFNRAGGFGAADDVAASKIQL